MTDRTTAEQDSVSTLENRYRRLLRVYPPAHRRDYGREMLGVLMQDARPGQRLPSPAEIADLLRAGLAARLRSVPGELRGSGWRDAAAVAGLIAALTLTAIPVKSVIGGLIYRHEYGDPMRGFGFDGGLMLDVGARTVAWLVVVIAVAAGARRTAVALAAGATAVEVAAVAVWLPGQSFRPFWMSAVLAAAALTTVLLATARRGRPVARVLGRRGVAVAAASVVLAVVLARITVWLSPGVPENHYYARLTLTAVAAVLLIAALRAPAPGVRYRILVLLAPVLAAPGAQSALADVTGLQLQLVVTPGLVFAQVAGMVALPLAAFAAAAAALHVAERHQLRPAVTRRMDGEPV
jgi:hypothetical protein